MPPNRTRLLLVRHGQSTWNAQKRWQGRADPPLTAEGAQQARDAVLGLQSHGPFDLVVTSTLQRARLTGELIAREMALALGAEYADLDERAAGPWEGMTTPAIEQSYPGYLADDLRPDGYEDDAELVIRAGAALVTMAVEHADQTLLVISHGGVINALERHAGPQLADPWQRLENLEGRWFEVGGRALTAVGERVRLLDQTTTGFTDDHYA